jgi:hypothetical protein
MTVRPWEVERQLTRAERHARDVGVTFEEEPHHIYKIGDKRLISVTTVLKLAAYYDFDHIDPIYRDRGRDAHTAVHYAMEGDLDRAHLDQTAEQGAMDLRPYVTAAEAFVRENDIEIKFPEAVVAAPRLGFAGKIDVFGHIRRSRSLAIFDWKLGELLPAYGVQLAAYKLAWWEMAHEIVAKRYCVQLLKNGKYKVREYNDRGDETRFLNALGVIQTRLEYGTLKPSDVWRDLQAP